MSDPFRDLSFPRTDLAVSAMRFAERVEDPAIFNHSMRTYLFGSYLGELQGLQAGRDYDDELLFLGCVLHDAGLSTEGNGDQRFDLDGADVAAHFLTEQGLSSERVEIVWDAIALHLCGDVALRKRPEIALVTAGAGYDLSPAGAPALPADRVERIHAALPRLHAAAVLHRTIVDQAFKQPQKAPLFSLPGELVRQETGAPWPTWRELTSSSPSWNDYDGYVPS
jgi:hypothetical protein